MNADARHAASTPAAGSGPFFLNTRHLPSGRAPGVGDQRAPGSASALASGGARGWVKRSALPCRRQELRCGVASSAEKEPSRRGSLKISSFQATVMLGFASMASALRSRPRAVEFYRASCGRNVELDSHRPRDRWPPRPGEAGRIRPRAGPLGQGSKGASVCRLEGEGAKGTSPPGPPSAEPLRRARAAPARWSDRRCVAKLRRSEPQPGVTYPSFHARQCFDRHNRSV
jgi:hypothetical protein